MMKYWVRSNIVLVRLRLSLEMLASSIFHLTDARKLLKNFSTFQQGILTNVRHVNDRAITDKKDLLRR
jgi:hypothetical protein